ncbi:MAG: SpoIID/LytB domain-containing protein [Clostridia bacterium]|nr:SpoIID/LytB domain-containing protein [Clostridia bacterium]
MKTLKIYIFALMMLVLSLCCSAEEIYIRVGLSFGKSAVTRSSFSFANGFQIGYLGADDTFSPTMFFASNSIYAEKTASGTFKFYDANSNGCLFETESGKSPVICPQGQDRTSAYTLYSGIKYPYYMLLTPNDDASHNVINLVESEQYIKGVLPSEIYPSWHEQALRAAAVATRTFTHQSLGTKHKAYGVDLCKTTCCQVYSGISKCVYSTNKATDDTNGQVIVYNDKLITAVYHAISGGVTESAAGAWGSNPDGYPYLTVVQTPFEKYEELSYGKWSRFITDAELAALIASSSYSSTLSGNIESIKVDDDTPGYLNNMTITDTSGNSVTLKTSSQINSLFSKYARSANFTITKMYLPSDNKQNLTVVTAMGKETIDTSKPVHYLTSDGEKTAQGVCGGYYIDGRGYGHGVGLSQYGSQYAANAGYTYSEILGIYYPGTTITDLSNVK